MLLDIFSQSPLNQYIVKGRTPNFIQFEVMIFNINLICFMYKYSKITLTTSILTRMPVSEVRSGQTASFALKKVKRSQIRKGMVMVSSKLNPRACWEFHGDIMVLHHPTTIATRYQVMTFLEINQFI